jgi:hypothetical protein
MGSVQEMPNGHFIISAGTLNDRVLEVTRAKELIWEAFCEKRSNPSPGEPRSWIPGANYRVFYASSLYPYYFTVRSSYMQNSLPSQTLGKAMTLTIDNIGSEADSFQVNVEGAAGKKIAKPVQVWIRSRQSDSVKIPFLTPAALRKDDELVIRVSSVNSRVTKTLKYKVQ